MSNDNRQGSTSFAGLRRILFEEGLRPETHTRIFTAVSALEEETIRDRGWAISHAVREATRSLLRRLQLVSRRFELVERKLAFLSRSEAAAKLKSRTHELTGAISKMWFQTHVLPKYVWWQAYNKRDREDRRTHWGALWYADLNRFKMINDILGHHPVGDAALRAFGQTLISSTRREESQVANLGGDEFAVLQTTPRWPDSKWSAERFTAKLAKRDWSRIHQALGENKPTASIAIVLVRLKSIWNEERHAKLIASEWLQLAEGLMRRVKQDRLSQILIEAYEWDPVLQHLVRVDLSKEESPYLLTQRLSDLQTT